MSDSEQNLVIGQAIRKARDAKGYTTREMGRGIGVDQSMIVRLENGKVTWSVARLMQACAFLGIDAREVITAPHMQASVRGGTAAA